MNRRVQRLGLDTAHCDRRTVKPPRAPARPLDLALTIGGYAPQTCTTNIKRRLVREGVIANVCALCGLKPQWQEWQGRALTLVLDHVNGDRNDWRRENLRLLCPNCNSQQPTFAGRNAKRGRRGRTPGRTRNCRLPNARPRGRSRRPASRASRS